MGKPCLNRATMLVVLLFQIPQQPLAQTSATDYFRSRATGTWGSTTTWESSSSGTSNWIPATDTPTVNANIVFIRNSHTVTIKNNTTVDQLDIQIGGVLEYATTSSAVLTVNDGPGSDIIIESGGTFKHNIAPGSQLPSFIGSATMQVQSGGVLQVGNNNGTPSNYAATTSGIAGNIIWTDSAIFNWNTTSSPASGVTYFPASAAIPVFRFSSAATIGGTVATVINGVLEAISDVTLSSTGAKTFRNGIIGTGNVSTSAINGGQIIVNGSTAKLGGGSLTINNNGFNIAGSSTVTLVSNKSIYNFNGANGTFTIAGTLLAGDYIMDGNCKVQINGTVKTSNTNGLSGNTNTTFANGFTLGNLGASSFIEYNRAGDQTLTPLSYANLNISGSGIKKVAAAVDISVAGTLDIASSNTFVLNGTNNLLFTGSTLNININAVFDNGGESQIKSGNFVNLYGTFISRSAAGFSGSTSTTIAGITSAAIVSIYEGSTVEYGRLGDQQVTNRNDYSNITFSGSGTKTIPTMTPSGTVTVKDNAIADVSNKTFGDINTSLTMTGGRLKVGGTGTSPDIGGTYNLTGGDIEFSNSGSTAQSIRSPKTYFNIVISGTNVKNGAGIVTLAPGGSFTVKTGGSYDNVSLRIDGASGTQSLILEAGSTFKTAVPSGFSGNISATPYPALNFIETFSIDPKSTIVYSRTGDQTITPLPGGYPNLLLKGSGLKTVATGAVDILANADSVVIDPNVILKVNSGATLNFNNRRVFIHSSSSGTGAIGEITDGTAALLNATNVVSERFIAARRAFRLLSSPVNSTTSIKANWMEGQNNPQPAYSVNYNNNPGYGTHITGSADPGDGFDATATNNPSLFTHNNATQMWEPVSSTNAALTAGAGFRLLVRGSRSVDLSNNSATPSNCILRAGGTLPVGSVTFNTATAPAISNNINAFSLVGNPYASPVNWDALTKSGLSLYYYVWDPNLNTRGAYVTYGSGITNPSVSSVDQNIQSAQAFFVQTKAANPSLTFNEANKTTTNTNVFRTASKVTNLSVQLLSDTLNAFEHLADGVTVMIDDRYDHAVDAEDAVKLKNLDENLAIVNKGILLSIDARPPVAGNDTVTLQLTGLKHSTYYFRFHPNNFSFSNTTAFLMDHYLNNKAEIDLSAAAIYRFAINSDPASFAPHRFSLVLKSKEVLAVSQFTLQALKEPSAIRLQWSMETRKEVREFEIEKSADGLQFKKSTTVRASMFWRYSWLDKDLSPGDNLYRIKAIERSGDVSYSNIVSVNIEKAKRPVTVFPNPATGNVIHLNLHGLAKGNYLIGLFNNASIRVYSGTLKHDGTSIPHLLKFPNSVSRGDYRLRISNGEETTVLNIQLK